MNYYYDVFLNFQDKYCMFYEWDENDSLDFVKKIPLIHIKSKSLVDILTSKIKINREFLDTIKGKTKLNKNIYLDYACIFADGKNSLAVEFNEDGIITSKSSISLDDELSINEFMYNILETSITYDVIEVEKQERFLRQDLKIKNILKHEIENIKKTKNYSKLKYLYLEWFNKLDNNYDEMLNVMFAKIDGKLTSQEYKIYKIIEMSYNNV